MALFNPSALAFSSYSYSSAGIGYAIPSNLVSRVIPALIENGEYEHPWIGFSGLALTPEINEQLELDHDQRGAYIQTIQPNSPAEAAGIKGGEEDLEIAKGTYIKAGGDIITKINERDVKGMDDIIAYLSSNTSIGDTITLHVIRDGKEMDVDLTLAARPTAAQRHANAEAETEEEPEVIESEEYTPLEYVVSYCCSHGRQRCSRCRYGRGRHHHRLRRSGSQQCC